MKSECCGMEVGECCGGRARAGMGDSEWIGGKAGRFGAGLGETHTVCMGPCVWGGARTSPTLPAYQLYSARRQMIGCTICHVSISDSLWIIEPILLPVLFSSPLAVDLSHCCSHPLHHSSNTPSTQHPTCRTIAQFQPSPPPCPSTDSPLRQNHPARIATPRTDTQSAVKWSAYPCPC